jgi:predicted metalloprotease
MKKARTNQSHATTQQQANALSARLELQADRFAGIWGNHANRERNILEAG